MQNIQFEHLFASKRDILWNIKLQELKGFYREYKHLNVHYVWNKLKMVKGEGKDDDNDGNGKHDDDDDDDDDDIDTNDDIVTKYKQLHQWMIHQRQEHTKFENQHCYLNDQNHTSITTTQTSSSSSAAVSSMTTYRIQKLESIGFTFDNRPHALFQMKLQQLKEYKRVHGHLQIPKNDKLLGRWVARQRELYREIIMNQTKSNTEENDADNHHDGGGNSIYDDEDYDDYVRRTSYFNTLTPERIQKLEEIGFEWKSTIKGTAYNHTWETRLQELHDYQQQHGNCNVPKTYKDNKMLGSWVRNQRAQYWTRQKPGKRSPMTNERIHQLENIGFQWKLRHPRKNIK